MLIVFTRESLESFNEWAQEDRKIHARIATLIRDIGRDPFNGIGKPEALKHGYSGYWSRRITEEHRLVYKVEKETIYIASCKYHYPR